MNKYPNNFGDFRGALIFKRLPVGDTKDEDGKFHRRLQTRPNCYNCNFLAWLLDHQQSTINAAGVNKMKAEIQIPSQYLHNVLYKNYH